MAETAYLQENVGEALKMALAAMVVDQPDDAVEFIGTYLVNHATKHEREEARAKKYASLAESIAVSARRPPRSRRPRRRGGRRRTRPRPRPSWIRS